MVFMGDRRPKQRHDAVPHDKVMTLPSLGCVPYRVDVRPRIVPQWRMGDQVLQENQVFQASDLCRMTGHSTPKRYDNLLHYRNSLL